MKHTKGTTTMEAISSDPKEYSNSLPMRRVIASIESGNGRSTDTLDCGHALPSCKGRAKQRRCWVCGPAILEALAFAEKKSDTKGAERLRSLIGTGN